MKKLIIGMLLLSMILLVGCNNDGLKYAECKVAEELSTGNFLVINGYYTTLEYNNSIFSKCCCGNERSEVCVCSEIEKTKRS